MNDAALLAAFGHPPADVAGSALGALHAGAAYHRLGVVLDVLEAYREAARLDTAQVAGLELLLPLVAGRSAWALADEHYARALVAEPALAEALFNHARVRQRDGAAGEALAAFDRCVTLAPHPRAPAHALLHANAHWHAATLLEDAGRGDQALARYRQALALCDNFGVHHARVARFLRARGLVAESIPHFERLMVYGHRYFTEFVLPPLESAAAAPPVPEFEVLYETSHGEPVVYWQGAYWRAPAGTRTIDRATFEPPPAVAAAASRGETGLLGRLFGRRPRGESGPPAPPPRAVRSAVSIADLESDT